MNRRNTFTKQMQQRLFMLLACCLALMNVSIEVDAQSPGGVSPNLRVWLKADLGPNNTTGGSITSWANKAPAGGNAIGIGSDPVPTHTPMLHNFNPAATIANRGYMQGLKLANVFPSSGEREVTMIFLGSRPSYPVFNGLFAQDWSSWGGFYDVDYGNDSPYVGTYGIDYAYYNGTGNGLNDVTAYGGMATFAPNVPYIIGLTQAAGAAMQGAGTNNFLSGQKKPHIYSGVDGNTSGTREVYKDFHVFHDYETRAYGSISEAIVFEQVLSPTQLAKVQSYLAIKYGITLLKESGTATSSYVSSANTTVWDEALNTGYNKNVFGIARDDASALHQKVSRSEELTDILVVSTNKDFTSANKDVSRTAITNDQVFELFGNNGLSSTTTEAFPVSCSGLAQYGSPVKILRNWRVQETGTLGTIAVQADLRTAGFNKDVLMYISEDPTFATIKAVVPGVRGLDGKSTFSYDFKTGQYVSFGGTFVGFDCKACKTLAKGNLPMGWAWYLSPLARINNSVVVDATNGAQAIVTLDDPGHTELYGGSSFPYGYFWTWTALDRYDNTNSVQTYTVKLDSSSTASFRVRAIDSNYGGQGLDKVEIIGSCKGITVPTKLTKLTPAGYEVFQTYNITSSNTVIGKNGATNYQYSDISTVQVKFQDAVDKIEVKWSIPTKTTIGNVWSRIWIEDFKLACPSPPEPNEDGLYLTQTFSSDTTETCASSKMTFTFNNFNCDSTVVNLSSPLPSGLSYKADTYSTGSLASSAPLPTYSGSSFTLNNLKLPPGESSFSVDVYSPNNTTATYSTQSTYTVVGGINSQSDNDEGTAGLNPTSVSFKASTALPVPTVTLTSDKTCYLKNSNSEVLYTATFTNATGAPISNLVFDNVLDKDQVYVNGSLSGTFGGFATWGNGGLDLGPYQRLEIKGMTLPVGTSTLTFKVNTRTSVDSLGSYTTLQANANSACALASLKQAYVITPPCVDCGIPTSVQANGSTTPTPVCSGANVSLTAACSAGTATWYTIGTSSNVKIGTGSPLVQNPTATTTYGVVCKVDTNCVAVFSAANKITVMVQPVVAAPTNNVSAAGTNAICVGSSTTLTATCAAGTTPIWYLGTAVAGTGTPLTVSPTATTTYTAKCKSTTTSCESATTSANDVVVTVNPVVAVPTSISSSAGATAVCSGTSTNLTATCASGSTVVWYIGTGVAGTGTPLTVSPTATTTYTAKCKSTATNCESISTAAEDVTVQILPAVPPATGVSSSAGTTICAGTSTNISATCASGSTVVWYSSGAVIVTGSPQTVTPAANVTYTAKCKSSATSCESASTSAQDLVIIVTPMPTAPTGVTAANSAICPNTSTTVSGACATGTIQWYIGATLVGTTSPLPVSPLATTTYRATCKAAVGSCESAPIASADVTVTVANPASPTGIASSAGGTLCTANTATNLSATCAAGSIVQWYIGTVFVNSGSPLAVAPLATTTYTATCKSSTGTCESAVVASSQITLTVNSCSIIINPTPPKTTPKDVPSSGTASTELNPQGGTGPYTYKAISCTSGSTSVAQGTSVTTAGGGSLVVSNESTGAYTYTPATGFVGTDTYCIEICDASTPNKICRIVTYTITVNATNGLLNVKALLQGALSGTTMTTALSTQNLIPTTDPYGKGATTTSTTLSGNAITDWVLVELRSSPATVTEGIAALLKNDGTIVNPDGSSPLKFTTTSGNFYVSVRHRNHLGVMTANMVAINSTAQTIDFTNLSTATYGNNAQVIVGSVKAMWAGNATGINLIGTDNVRYSSGDINAVTGYLTAQTGSAGGVKTNVYTKEDTNLDGIVRYSGAARDILPIITTVTTHPSNPSPGSTGFIVSQTF